MPQAEMRSAFGAMEIQVKRRGHAKHVRSVQPTELHPVGLVER